MKLLTPIHVCKAVLRKITAHALNSLRVAIKAMNIDLPQFTNGWRPDKEKQITNLSPDLTATVFSSLREGLLVADPYGRIVRVNEAFTRVTGYGQDEVLGQDLISLSTMRQLATFYAPMKTALACHGHWAGEARGNHKSGTELTLRFSVSLARGGDGEIQHYIALLSDITELKKRQQRLEHNAYYDALTQLPNRLSLAEWMRQAMGETRSHQQTMAVAFIDLDGFKAVNDCYGHDLGDRVLRIVAQRIKATIRKNDTLARLGGDEFVAGLAGLQQPEDCQPVLERMLDAASTSIWIDGQTIQVSASIGVALFPEHGHDSDTLIRKADQAMYLSKRSGGRMLAFYAT